MGRDGTRDMREVLRTKRVLATMSVDLAATPSRCARTAKLSVRAAKLPIRLRDKHTKSTTVKELTVVWARETWRTSAGRIEWLLLTNAEVTDGADACAVVQRYCYRWRIEEFHRSWKSGLCNVEQTQLRSTDAVIKWATVLAAVASRAEQLRYLSREQPDAPAETILSATEIETLVLMKRRIKSRTETVSRRGLTVAKAVRWIADMGGYVGNKSSGKPGAITIGRGLEKLLNATEVVEALQKAGKLR